MELDLSWVIYPPDDRDDLYFENVDDAVVSFNELGNGTQLWCDVLLHSNTDPGSFISGDDILYQSLVLIAEHEMGHD